VEIAVSGNLVLLRTPPGSAHVVASALDRGRTRGGDRHGCGDDTVLVVAAEHLGGEALCERLEEITGAGPDGPQLRLPAAPQADPATAERQDEVTKRVALAYSGGS